MSPQYLNFLKKYLAKDDDALLWVLSFMTLCHLVDDIVDNPVKDDIHILKSFEYAAIVYSSVFYQRNIHILYSLVKFSTNSYMDSVIYERSTEDWKRKVADVLRQNANDVVLAAVEIVNNVDTRREASLELREISYWAHHNQLGEPT